MLNQTSCKILTTDSTFFFTILYLSRTIYHFDPTNFPPNHKLPTQMTAKEQQATRKNVRAQNDAKEFGGKANAVEESVKPGIEISPLQNDDLKCESELALIGPVIEHSNSSLNTVLCTISHLQISPKRSHVSVKSSVEGF